MFSVARVIELSIWYDAVAYRAYGAEQNDMVRQHMQHMDAQIRQRVQHLQQCL